MKGVRILFVPTGRHNLLPFLPRGGVVAEIGVARGDFSRLILDNNTPSKLHLIDPWEHQQRTDYANDPNNVDGQAQESRYRGILDKFAPEIAAGTVDIHRMYSQDAVTLFPDNYFDWIYIDALHTYDGVRDDLENYFCKVKDGGFILGHDYTNNPNAVHMGFGVIEAVNSFVMRKGLSFVALSGDDWPTYVLTRPGDNPAANSLTANLIYNYPGCVEIRDYPGRQFQHKILIFNKTEIRTLPSF